MLELGAWMFSAQFLSSGLIQTQGQDTCATAIVQVDCSETSAWLEIVKSGSSSNDSTVRKVVGRRPAHITPACAQLEDLSSFLFQNAKHVLPKRELFPVRKSVGQARRQRD